MVWLMRPFASPAEILAFLTKQENSSRKLNKDEPAGMPAARILVRVELDDCACDGRPHGLRSLLGPRLMICNA
jgi:hypothetical protein